MSKKKDKDKSLTQNILRNKIVLAVILAIVVIFTIVVSASVNIIGSYLIDEADIRFQSVTDNVAEEITTWFTNEAQIVLSQKAAIEINDEFDPDELTKYLTKIVEDYNEEGYIYDLYFVNTDNVMSSGYGYIPDPSIDFRERPWYKDTLDNEGLFYSAPYKDSNLDRYVVTISTTCYKKDGTFAGVLALDIFVDTLFSIADDKELDGNSYCFLLDNNMGIATHPNKDYSYVDDEPIHISSIEDNPYCYVIDFITGGMDDSAIDNRSYAIEDYDGVSRTIYVSDIDCCGWYVVACIEDNVYMQPMFQTLFIVVLALVVCLIIGIVCSRIASASIIKRLNDASEEAKLANETKGQFLANMSHEIRTPINAIIGMNEMVIRENTDPKINDYALDISSASRSLITIVNDILDFSKIESGKMEIIKTEFNIASVINDIINMSESRLGNKELALFFDIDPTIPAGLIGDEVRIKQVILNMMTNAIKYTNTGFVTMRAEYTTQSYGINLDIFVKDSGIGISEENIANLYQSFRRFDSKRNRSIEGTGLGLSITKKLVQNMGGFINVHSEEGIGSEFSFSIPLEVSDSKQFISVENKEQVKLIAYIDYPFSDIRLLKESKAVSDRIENNLGIDVYMAKSIDDVKYYANYEKASHILVDKKSYFDNEDYFAKLADENVKILVLQDRGNAEELPENIINFNTPFNALSLVAYLNNRKHVETSALEKLSTFKAPNAKILIVDDNAMNLKVAAGLMKPYEMKITTVDSGIKAINLLKEDPTYDIVFMDHMMPIMDGIEATKNIRELEGNYYRILPIIALTANTINNAKKMFMESGFDDFLAKPINVTLLDRVLRNYLPHDKKEMSNSKKGNASEAKNSTVSSNSEFEPSVGLNYTGGNEELYLDILKEYVENSNEMKNLITSSFDNRDWANYVIKVHALKSTSLTIGAAPLSELAKELELSGKAGKYDPILNKTKELIEKYTHVLELATTYLKSKGITPSTKQKTEDLSEFNVDMEIANEFAQSLAEAVADFDTDKAEEIYQKVCEQGEEYEKYFQDVIAHVRNFEYDEATEELERRLKK